MKQTVFSKQAPEAVGPYSHAVIAGNLVFVSGQLPIVPGESHIPVDVKGQTRQCLENVKAILSEVGLDLVNVTKTTVYIKNMNDFNQVNEVYGEYFSREFPARVCIEASRLPKDALVEIDAIALKS